MELVAQFTNVIVGIVSGIIGVSVSTYFALAQHRKEKWWDTRAAAYSELISALYSARRFTTEHFDSAAGGKIVSDERDKELRVLARSSADAILKARDTGIFYLSNEAVARLTRYEHEAVKARQTTDWLEYLEKDGAAISSCLGDIIRIARKDLQV
ncbi:MAG: hypothetical protein ACT4SY_06050 [Hyphomicrobiales bacterium]